MNISTFASTQRKHKPNDMYKNWENQKYYVTYQLMT